MPIAGPKPADALPDHEIVIRGVASNSLHQRTDGKREVSKGSFSASSKSRDPEEGMSAHVLSLLVAGGVDPSDGLKFAPNFEVLMALKVSELHANGLWVVPRPAPHPAHCNVLGVTEGKRRILLRIATFLRRPDDVVKSGE